MKLPSTSHSFRRSQAQISPVLLAATIATEDKDFYIHPGFDVWAISRALWENYRTGGEGETRQHRDRDVR